MATIGNQRRKCMTAALFAPKGDLSVVLTTKHRSIRCDKACPIWTQRFPWRLDVVIKLHLELDQGKLKESISLPHIHAPYRKWLHSRLRVESLAVLHQLALPCEGTQSQASGPNRLRGGRRLLLLAEGTGGTRHGTRHQACPE